MGVADVAGVPHIYQFPFLPDLDDYADFYLVSPIDSQTLDLVVEDWGIWTRWSGAFDRGEVTRETHPALPEDRERHMIIEELLGNRLAIDSMTCRKVTARFRSVAPGWNGMEVEWTPTTVPHD